MNALLEDYCPVVERRYERRNEPERYAGGSIRSW
jgi:hypothetical protein